MLLLFIDGIKISCCFFVCFRRLFFLSLFPLIFFITIGFVLFLCCFIFFVFVLLVLF